MILVTIILFSHSFLFSNYIQHVIIGLDGSSHVGMIDSMNTESVFISPNDSNEQKTLTLNDVYYIYGTNGKLFYISPNYVDRIDLIEERSGFLVTTSNDTIYYTTIQVDRRMDTPYFYLSSDEFELAHKISMFDVHLIRIDASYMEHSVRRGTLTGTGIILVGMLLQSFSQYGTKSESLSDDATFGTKLNAFGGAVSTTITNFVPGGNQYQSVTIFYPLSTIGWMIYDYIYDKRTHYFRPLIREDQFPQSMYWFNPKRIMKEKVDETLGPVRDALPF